MDKHSNGVKDEAAAEHNQELTNAERFGENKSTREPVERERRDNYQYRNYRARRESHDNRDNRDSRDNSDAPDQRYNRQPRDNCNYEPRYNREQGRERQVPNDPPYIAYVGNLPAGLVQGDVIKIFSDFEVKNVRLIKDHETDEFKGYGYVEFETLAQLKRALSMNGRIQLDNLSAPLRIDIADHRRQGGNNNAGGFSRNYRQPNRFMSQDRNNTRDSADTSPTHSTLSMDRARGHGQNYGYNRGGRGNSSYYATRGEQGRRNNTDDASCSSSNSRDGGSYNRSRNYNSQYNNRNNNNYNNNNKNQNFTNSRNSESGQRYNSYNNNNNNGNYANFFQNRNRDRRGHYNPNNINHNTKYDDPNDMTPRNEEDRASPSRSTAAPDDTSRPKLLLKPRTVCEPINALAETQQAASIFGQAKPNDGPTKQTDSDVRSND